MVRVGQTSNIFHKWKYSVKLMIAWSNGWIYMSSLWIPFFLFRCYIRIHFFYEKVTRKWFSPKICPFRHIEKSESTFFFIGINVRSDNFFLLKVNPLFQSYLFWRKFWGQRSMSLVFSLVLTCSNWKGIHLWIPYSHRVCHSRAAINFYSIFRSICYPIIFLSICDDVCVACVCHVLILWRFILFLHCQNTIILPGWHWTHDKPSMKQ